MKHDSGSSPERHSSPARHSSPELSHLARSLNGLNEASDISDADESLAFLAPTSTTDTIQRKCACGGGCPLCQSGDAMEREADRTAERVMSSSQSPVEPHVSQSSTTTNVVQKKVNTKAASPAAAAPQVGPLNNGRPMAKSDQAWFESRFQSDFSHVRIHDDQAAWQSADRLSAKAFTSGSHIVFGKNEYQPGSHSGKSLLAHELAHVMQQRQMGSALIQRACLTETRLCFERRQDGGLNVWDSWREHDTRRTFARRIIAAVLRRFGIAVTPERVTGMIGLMNFRQVEGSEGERFNIRFTAAQVATLRRSASQSGEQQSPSPAEPRPDTQEREPTPPEAPQVQRPDAQQRRGESDAEGEQAAQDAQPIPPEVRDFYGDSAAEGEGERLSQEELLDMYQIWQQYVDGNPEFGEGEQSFRDWATFLQRNQDRLQGRAATGSEGSLELSALEQLTQRMEAGERITFQSAEEQELIRQMQPPEPLTETSGPPEWLLIPEDDRRLLLDMMSAHPELFGQPESGEEQVRALTEQMKRNMAMRISLQYFPAEIANQFMRWAEDPWFWIQLVGFIEFYLLTMIVPGLQPIAAGITAFLLTYVGLSMILRVATAYSHLDTALLVVSDAAGMEAAARQFAREVGPVAAEVLLLLGLYFAGRAASPRLGSMPTGRAAPAAEPLVPEPPAAEPVVPEPPAAARPAAPEPVVPEPPAPRGSGPSPAEALGRPGPATEPAPAAEPPPVAEPAPATDPAPSTGSTSGSGRPASSRPGTWRNRAMMMRFLLELGRGVHRGTGFENLSTGGSSGVRAPAAEVVEVSPEGGGGAAQAPAAPRAQSPARALSDPAPQAARPGAPDIQRPTQVQRPQVQTPSQSQATTPTPAPASGSTATGGGAAAALGDPSGQQAAGPSAADGSSGVRVVTRFEDVDLTHLSAADRAAYEQAYITYQSTAQQAFDAGTRRTAPLSQDNYVRFRYGVASGQLVINNASGVQQLIEQALDGAISPEAAFGFDPAEIAAARIVLGQAFTSSDIQAFADAWNDVANAGESETLTADNSRRLFDNHRTRFWREVRNRPALVAFIEAMGFTFPSGATTAPTRTLSDGRVIRLTIDHIIERQTDPTRALDPSNLRFSFGRENSVVLRQVTEQDPFQQAERIPLQEVQQRIEDEVTD